MTLATVLPPIVTLCGSTRFKDAFDAIGEEFTVEGWIVLTPGSYSHTTGRELSREQKSMLDHLHVTKIGVSDLAMIVNPGGYIGESTTREVRAAKMMRVPRLFLTGSDGPMTRYDVDPNGFALRVPMREIVFRLTDMGVDLSYPEPVAHTTGSAVES